MKKIIIGSLLAAAVFAVPTAAPARTYSSFSLYVGNGGYYDPGYYDAPYYDRGYYHPDYYSYDPGYYYNPGYVYRSYRGRDWRDDRRWDHDRGRHRDWDRGRHEGHRWHDRDDD